MAYINTPGTTGNMSSGGEYDNFDEVTSAQYPNAAAASASQAAASAADAAESAAEAASSLAQIGTAVEDAEDAAAAAAVSEANALASANSASGSATTAANAATNANTSATSAASSATSAANSATSATNSATSAGASAVSATNSATAAAGSATAAYNSATAANVSANSATNSATAASASATSASTYATNSANSATASATSATNSATSASAASNSATNASTYANNASTSANAASASASNSQTSANNSAGSATSSANSATAAADSAATATTKASEAATSATSAADSATSAASSASTATTQASNASTSATNAANSSTSAGTSATNAATSATSAANSATSASTSATNAATSATSAAGSASNATTSATSAATAQAAAEAARDQALAAFDNFDDKYLGEKATDPTTDNDGNPLVTGALYFNTTSNSMKVYSGTVWLDAYASLSGALLAVNNLNDVSNVVSARANLGLGTAATTESTAYATAAQGTKADNAVSAITSNDGSVVITTSGTSKDLSVGIAGSTGTLISQVRNQTGATLTKGTVVYISGASGNKALVSKALANSDATSAQTYGVIQADINNNQNGYVVVVGSVSGIDTSAYADGTQLYLSGITAGAYTSTKPYAPTHLVYVGVVTYSHANQGTIQIKIQNGYEMDELHDVSAQSPSNGDTLVFNTSTSLWTKTPQSTLSVASAATVPFNGVTSKPTTLSGYGITDAQATLVSGTNIKTVNGTSILGSGNIQIDGGVTSFNTRTGDITLSSGDVTTALGYTPYNSSNPAGYITSSALSSYLPLSGGTLTGASTISVSTWAKLTLETIGTTAKVRQGSDSNGLNFTSNALWNGAWVEDDTTKKKFAYIQHLGNGRHEFRTSPAGAGVSWTTSLTIDESSVNSTVALTQGGNQVLHAGNYTSYSPSLTGSGASGTWGISVSGSAATATTATNQSGGTVNATTGAFSDVVTLQTTENIGSGTYTPGAGGSLSFSGASRYLGIPATSAFVFTGNFTIEAWVYLPTTSGGPQSIFGSDNTPNCFDFRWYGNIGSWQASLNSGGGTNFGGTITANTWTHVALVRSGSTIKLYVGGVATGTTATNSSTLGYSSQAYSVGRSNGASNYFGGLMTNLRVNSTTAVYTTNFTPSTSPLTAISGTQLLLLSSSSGAYITDSSTNNFTLTNNNTVSYNASTPLSGGSSVNYIGIVNGSMANQGGLSGWGTTVTSGVSTISYPALFKNPNGTVGSITTTGSATAYNTSSDRRLKYNIESLTPSQSGAIIDALKPRSFNWVADGAADVGFIADEYQQVIPNGVTGAPNAVDENGSPQYQMLDAAQPELIAYLVMEIQALRKRSKRLEGLVLDVDVTLLEDFDESPESTPEPEPEIQVAEITSEELAAFTTAELAALSSEQVAALTSDQISGLTVNQLSVLSPGG
jgi:hypothetical protein